MCKFYAIFSINLENMHFKMWQLLLSLLVKMHKLLYIHFDETAEAGGQREGID